MVHYFIDGDNNRFGTLRDAKHHVFIAYTQNERRKYLRDTYICKVVNEEVVTITPIIVTNDSYSFGKTKRL
jgi:hypothetical protein